MFTMSSLIFSCSSILKGTLDQRATREVSLPPLCCQEEEMEIGFCSSSAIPGAVFAYMLSATSSPLVLYSVKDPSRSCRNERIFFSLTFNWHLVLQALNSTAYTPSLRKKKSLLETTSSASAHSLSHLVLTEEKNLYSFFHSSNILSVGIKLLPDRCPFSRAN